MKKRILFIAEPISLAHIGRTCALAESLPANEYEIYVASTQHYCTLFNKNKFNFKPISGSSPYEYQQKLAQGKPLFDLSLLAKNLSADKKLIEAIKPNIVIGDSRISLGLFASQSNIPYANLSNAYWSPYSPPYFPLPEHLLSKIIGYKLANKIFQKFNDVILKRHIHDYNILRKAYQLPPVNNICEMYTNAEHVLYADPPSLFQMSNLPKNHKFLGPILWEPTVPLPAWWDKRPTRQNVYVTLGSSGSRLSLTPLLQYLNQFDVNILFATAGRNQPKEKISDKVFMSEWLPGLTASAESSLVICNGGAATTHHALAYGVPVIGIVSNMDQYKNMHAIESFGAGKMLRTDQINRKNVTSLLHKALIENSYSEKANLLRNEIDAYHAPTRFKTWLQEVI